VNLGRFGLVQKGDILNLTDHEFNMVQADPVDRKRFRALKEGEPVEPLKFEPRTEKPGESAEDKAAREKWNAREEARIAALNKSNDAGEVARQNVREMKHEALLAKAVELEAGGASLGLPQKPTRNQLIAAIEAFLERDKAEREEKAAAEKAAAEKVVKAADAAKE